MALSDGNDASGLSLDSFTEILLGVADRITYSAIVSGYPPCDGASPGWLHIDAVEALGGVLGDVCADGYPDVLLDLVEVSNRP